MSRADSWASRFFNSIINNIVLNPRNSFPHLFLAFVLCLLDVKRNVHACVMQHVY